MRDLFDLSAVVPIDLGLLEAERRGLAPVPPERHIAEQARNQRAADSARSFGTGDQYPVDVPSVEEHLLSKGYTRGAVSEALLDMAKHEGEGGSKLASPGDAFAQGGWQQPPGAKFPIVDHGCGAPEQVEPPATPSEQRRADAFLDAVYGEPARSFALGARVRLRGDGATGRIATDAIRSINGRGLIQVVRWDSGDSIWELVAELEVAPEAPAGLRYTDGRPVEHIDYSCSECMGHVRQWANGRSQGHRSSCSWAFKHRCRECGAWTSQGRGHADSCKYGRDAADAARQVRELNSLAQARSEPHRVSEPSSDLGNNRVISDYDKRVRDSLTVKPVPAGILPDHLRRA